MMRRITLATALLLDLGWASLARASTGPVLMAHVIAGGGGRSTSAGYVVQGTIGQAIGQPSVSASADYRVEGAFWPAAVQPDPLPTPGVTPVPTPDPSRMRLLVPLVLREHP
jgi:hypothetical protein